MRVNENLPSSMQQLKDAEIFNHGHLPVAAAFCKRLKLVDLVNDLVPSQMELEPGHLVQAMVLDTLSGRTPLYRLQHFMAKQDIELLLGKSVPAEKFNDTNLARGLDAIFESGTSKILTRLGVEASRQFSLDATTVSYDTTSTNVWGDYTYSQNDEGPTITHGYSKDHRPDLKQFMTELLCVERGVPIFGQTLDGNSSDKESNNRILSRISKLMTQHGVKPGAFIYVADSAMVTKDNLKEIGSDPFISRLPATYKECERVIAKAVEKNQWHEIGTLAENYTASKRPIAQYKAYEGTVELYSQEYRAVVIHSSSHDKRRQKKLNKAILASEKDINKSLAKSETQYFCEEDAKLAAQQMEKFSTRLHKVKTTINSFEVAKPGRPPKDRPVPTQTRYRISCTVIEKENEILKERERSGCFVLITTVPVKGESGLNCVELLKAYKGQYGVESNFAFLKDPLIVNDIFIKKPHRIDALGMILIISLLIWRLMERNMRTYLDKKDKTIEGWEKRKTKKPTSFMMTTAIGGIMVVRMVNHQRFFFKRPGKRPSDFLEALGVNHNVFLDPLEKCKPIIPENFSPKG